MNDHLIPIGRVAEKQAYVQAGSDYCVLIDLHGRRSVGITAAASAPRVQHGLYVKSYEDGTAIANGGLAASGTSLMGSPEPSPKEE